MGEKPKIDMEAYSCFDCNYIGTAYKTTAEGDACPNCGTIEGNGFGLAENDPRITSDELPGWAWTYRERKG